MSRPWPMVPISEIAKPVARPVAVQPGTTYRTIGVKWWGEGAYERETIDGAETAAKTLSVVRRGGLIIKKILGRPGSAPRASGALGGRAGAGGVSSFGVEPGGG